MMVQMQSADCGLGSRRGQLLGAKAGQPRSLRPTLRSLHALAAVSFACLAGTSVAVGARGRFGGDAALMLGAAVILGCGLMGMLPFALQMACQ